ncbi:hypothetical protein B0H14DRAFT_2706147 [Mycena olivaceomarginata]|nr:hypothetical protein B0H14DRAFT_2706147 [Mycena olivaceomarginata]
MADSPASVLSKTPGPASSSSTFTAFNTPPAGPVSSLSLSVFNTPPPKISDSLSTVLTSLATIPTFTAMNTAVLPTYETSLRKFNDPSHTYTLTSSLPTSINPTHSGLSTSVSSASTAYDPVSTVATVTVSRLQTSFSAIGISSNILAAEIFLYGAYLVITGFSKNRGLTFATILLFIFCTAHCALQIATSTLYNRLESTSIGNSEAMFNRTFKDYSSVAIATNAVYITSNIIADSIFILRCYAIWNFQLKIIIVPILLTLAVAGVGYTNAFWPLHSPNSLRSANLVMAEFSFKLFKISILLSIFTTVILMFLTAGRILWIGRTARTLLGPTVISKYHTASAMILESGAIYFASAIAFTTIGFTLDPIYVSSSLDLFPLILSPTIIAVRVGLGRSVVSVERFGTGTARGVSHVSLLQSHPKGTRSRDEEAHGGLRNDTGGKEQHTSKASSLDPQMVCMC